MSLSIARPPIVVAEKDHDRLFALAEARQGRDPGASALMEELDRARIVGEGLEADAAAGMNSRVDFVHDGVAYRDVRLVYPADADFANGKLSVLSHVGAMLLGLSAGQSIAWESKDGREHTLSVTAVRPA